MDSTEAQLRFGSALSESTEPSHPNHPMHSLYVRTQRETRTAQGLSVSGVSVPVGGATNTITANNLGGQQQTRNEPDRVYQMIESRRRNRVNMPRKSFSEDNFKINISLLLSYERIKS